MMSNVRWLFLAVCVVLAATVSFAAAQEKPAAPAAQAPAQPASSSTNPAKHRHTWADDFLIHGTVFTDKGLAFSGAQVRIRRAGDKKFRWQDATNSRGDFAIRVPHDASYEVLTHAKGFVDQTKTVNAKPGLTDETLAFKMEPAGGRK